MEFYHKDVFYMLDGLLTTLNIGPMLLAVVGYVLSSLALYTMAKRRGICHAWLSWVPVANVWILGSLSDQYRYVARGQRKNKRKILLGLKIAAAVVAVIVFIIAMVGIVNVTASVIYNSVDEEDLFITVLGGLMGALGLLVLMLPLYIVTVVFRYMALYDIYMSMDPENAVLFLVLSIIFHVTEPFFLFFNREKEKGMPPRRPQPEFIPGCENPGAQQKPDWEPRTPQQPEAPRAEQETPAETAETDREAPDEASRNSEEENPEL